MSEYQYYEFLAIDRPLTEREMADLRALSTRAHITPVSFTNHYDWGGLKADPKTLMKHYFDAHVYEACRAIVDLAEAYQLQGFREAFDQALNRFMATHARRGALARRLVAAGLWQGR
jgi:hypothetical protein